MVNPYYSQALVSYILDPSSLSILSLNRFLSSPHHPPNWHVFIHYPWFLIFVSLLSKSWLHLHLLTIENRFHFHNQSSSLISKHIYTKTSFSRSVSFWKTILPPLKACPLYLSIYPKVLPAFWLRLANFLIIVGICNTKEGKLSTYILTTLCDSVKTASM